MVAFLKNSLYLVNSLDWQTSVIGQRHVRRQPELCLTVGTGNMNMNPVFFAGKEEKTVDTKREFSNPASTRQEIGPSPPRRVAKAATGDDFIKAFIQRHSIAVDEPTQTAHNVGLSQSEKQ
jgi:hypothetical protein